MTCKNSEIQCMSCRVFANSFFILMCVNRQGGRHLLTAFIGLFINEINHFILNFQHLCLCLWILWFIIRTNVFCQSVIVPGGWTAKPFIELIFNLSLYTGLVVWSCCLIVCAAVTMTNCVVINNKLNIVKFIRKWRNCWLSWLKRIWLIFFQLNQRNIY